MKQYSLRDYDKLPTTEHFIIEGESSRDALQKHLGTGVKFHSMRGSNITAKQCFCLTPVIKTDKIVLYTKGKKVWYQIS